MQPPDTEPTTVPSSQMASVAPTGRGLEPQVLMTVTSSQRWPAGDPGGAGFQYFEVDAVHGAPVGSEVNIYAARGRRKRRKTWLY